MQKFEERNTYTPTDIPHVRSNCDQPLKALRGRSGASGLKTSLNNPDAALTATGQAGTNLRVSSVYVLSDRGKPLMPCAPRKARVLLKQGKAKVIKRTPFTIQLLQHSGTTVQDLSLGVDAGYSHVGLSVVSGNKEVYASDVELRSDIVRLNAKRKMYRKIRRGRLWYRKPRFLNRKKSKGWLAPSIEHKLDSHLKVVAKVQELLPISDITVEVAAFDIQKIQNPEIEGGVYQQGDQLGFWNVREYVLYRDRHKCRHCKGKSKDKILQIHHIISRQVGGDRPTNLLTLCKTCHDDHHKGKIKLNAKPGRGFKAEAFMTMVRWKLVNILQTNNTVPVSHTHGYITKGKRIEAGYVKSHINDAFVIASGHVQARAVELRIKQVRKCNRKLFKGARSHIRNTAPRFVHGFQRYDKVLFDGMESFVFGRRSRGDLALRQLDGTKVHNSASVKGCTRLETANTLLVERVGVLAAG